jgi:hypothetical protein
MVLLLKFDLPSHIDCSIDLTNTHVTWLFWARIDVPIIFGQEVNIVEYITVPIKVEVGFLKAHVEQHGSIEGEGVSL